MERKTIPAEAVELYTQFIHGEISRRAFVDGLKRFAVTGLSTGALIDALMPNYAAAQQVRKDDERKDGDPLQGARVMLTGRTESTTDPDARRRYLDRQPEAEMFAGFADFGFYKMIVTGAHLVAGFGRIVDISPQDLLLDLGGAEAMVEAEADVVAHMNADHAQACRLYAMKLLGASDGDWRCAGCDPEGLELQNGRTALRLVFPQRVNSPGVLRQVLKQLADQVRAV